MIEHYKQILIYLTLFFICCSHVSASEVNSVNDNKAEWTLGLGLGVFDYHFYPGARETNRFILPVPYFTYRSSRFEVDRGIKSFLYHSNEVVVDISADFGLPVKSDEVEARKGMPDLDFMMQIGPSLEFKLNDKNKNYFDVRFEIPVRAAFVTDFTGVEDIGYLLEPRFSFDHQRSAKTGLSHKAIIGLKFATQDFYAYYYAVSAEFMTTTRPVYNSDAGFGGSFINYRITYRTSDFVYWILSRYQSLRGAEFENSPLLEKKDYYFIGVGFSWVFAGSL